MCCACVVVGGGAGSGQTLKLFVIPEVLKLILDTVAVADPTRRLHTQVHHRL